VKLRRRAVAKQQPVSAASESVVLGRKLGVPLLERALRKPSSCVLFVGAGISRAAPTSLPLASPILTKTLEHLQSDPDVAAIIDGADLSEVLRDMLSLLPRPGFPPERVYDAIFEYVGRRALAVFDCLAGDIIPNANHRIIAALACRGAKVLTTNFDTCIERAGAPHECVWHVHGSIDCPDEIVATMRNLGEAAFDLEKIDHLVKQLEGRTVLFAGYGGTDPDLIPAFRRARPAQVFWNVFSTEEYEKRKDAEPWSSLARHCSSFTQLVGDSFADVLAPATTSVKPSLGVGLDQAQVDPDVEEYRIRTSLKAWEGDAQRRATTEEKLRAILLIAYEIASSLNRTGHWNAVERLSAAAIQQGIATEGSNLWREAVSFRAEACLRLGAIGPAIVHLATVASCPRADAIQAQIFLNMATAAAACGEVEKAEDCLCRARDIGLAVSPTADHPSGGKRLAAFAFSSLGALYGERRRYVAAENNFRMAERLFHECGDLASSVVNGVNKVQALIGLGDSRAYPEFLRVSELGESLGDPPLMVLVAHVRAMLDGAMAQLR
jgi:hypothetical protein